MLATAAHTLLALYAASATLFALLCLVVLLILLFIRRPSFKGSRCSECILLGRALRAEAKLKQLLAAFPVRGADGRYHKRPDTAQAVPPC